MKKRQETLIIKYKADIRELKAAIREIEKLEKTMLRLKKSEVEIFVKMIAPEIKSK